MPRSNGLLCWLTTPQVNALAQGDPLSYAKKRKLFELKSFLGHHAVPKLLRRKVLGHYQNVWEVKSPINEAAMLREPVGAL